MAPKTRSSLKKQLADPNISAGDLDQSLVNSSFGRPVPRPSTQALMSDTVNERGELDNLSEILERGFLLSRTRNIYLPNDSTNSPGPSCQLSETTIPDAEKSPKNKKIAKNGRRPKQPVRKG